MDNHDRLAERFERHRAHLRGVAYRMLGSLSEADDAVQETWLRVSRADTSDIENFAGWLTTIIGRICLDMLRARQSRREESIEATVAEHTASGEARGDPEQEALLADSVGLAMLVVLDRLSPAERLALVLHDLFSIPFDEIAPIVERSATATRQLASRARRRVAGTPTPPSADHRLKRAAVDAFYAAARAGDLQALVSVLAPDVVFRSDRVGAVPEMRGAAAVAGQAVKTRASAARPALVNGSAGLIIAPRGRLRMVLEFTVEAGTIVAIDLVSDPQRLAQVELALLDD